MATSKKKSTATPHATQSYAQMMSQAQLNALKPHIDALVSEKMAESVNRIFASVYQVITQHQAQTQIRQMAFEKLLKQHTHWFKDDVLADTVAEVEDAALNFAPTEEPAQEGDKVRIEVSYLDKPEEPTEKVLIASLMAKSQSGNVQTLIELETALIGKKVGEAVEFLLPAPPEEGKEPEHLKTKALLKRVSRKK